MVPISVKTKSLDCPHSLGGCDIDRDWSEKVSVQYRSHLRLWAHKGRQQPTSELGVTSLLENCEKYGIEEPFTFLTPKLVVTEW